MARVKVNVDRESLIAAVAQAESNGAYSTMSELYEKAAAAYNDRHPEGLKPITPSVVGLRIVEFGIKTKTVPGKRGGGGGGGGRPRTSSTPKTVGHSVDEIFTMLESRAFGDWYAGAFDKHLMADDDAPSVEELKDELREMIKN